MEGKWAMMTKTVCVVGLGYIGLTSAVMFSNYGMKVHGVDINPSVVRNINEKNYTLKNKVFKKCWTEQ